MRASIEVEQFHQTLIVVDAQQVSHWDREVLEELRAGSCTSVNVTCAIWEDARAALENVCAWYRLLRAHSDLIVLARSGSDVVSAKAAGKAAVVLGFQNTSPIEDDLGLVEAFYQLGVRVMQLTYNNQNLVGGGCYEPNDGGLSRFGQHVVREMNRVGMVIDVSHTGERTALEAIDASTRPVVATHANPRSFYEHPRNLSDVVLRALAANGGVVGVCVYPFLVGPGDVTVSRFCELVKRTVELVGIDHVGIGTDLARKQPDERLRWMRMGRWTHDADHGAGSPVNDSWPEWPSWFRTAADFPNITAALLDSGFSRTEAAAIVGRNWLRVFEHGFEAE